MLGTVGDNPVFNVPRERQLLGFCLTCQMSQELQPVRSFTRRQIKEHNAAAGWSQWVTLRGNVYDVTGLKEHFLDFVNRKRQQAGRTGRSQSAERTRPGSGTVAEDVSRGGVRSKPSRSTYQQKGKMEDSRVWSANTAKRRSCKEGEEGRALHDARQIVHHGLCRHTDACRKSLDELQSTQLPTSNGCRNSSDSDIDTSDEDDETDDCLADDEDDSYRCVYSADANDGNVTDGDTNDNGLDAFADDTLLVQLDVLSALHKSGLTHAEIETEMGPYQIGVIERMPSWKFWQGFRADVMGVIGDLTEKEAKGRLGQYEGECLRQLQRWLRKYIDIDPSPSSLHGDCNSHVFLVPVDPTCLREWMRDWKPFDTSLPEDGAWQMAEGNLLSPLGNTHDTFVASLRAHFSPGDGFCFDIEGEAVWDLLPSDIILNDQMMVKQQAVDDSRLKRTDLWDPRCMHRRREKLGAYFRRKYHFSETEMAKFSLWADVMERNKNELDELC